jgi:hypothetical protein
MDAGGRQGDRGKKKRRHEHALFGGVASRNTGNAAERGHPGVTYL